MRQKHRPFQPAEDVFLKNLLAQGASMREAARQMGRSYGSVQGRAYKLGLRTRKPATNERANVQISVNLPESTVDDLYRLALRRGEPAAALIREAVKRYLKRET